VEEVVAYMDHMDDGMDSYTYDGAVEVVDNIDIHCNRKIDYLIDPFFEKIDLKDLYFSLLLLEFSLRTHHLQI